MSSIKDKVDYLLVTKNRIKTQLIDLGVDIDDNTPFRQYADAIQQLYADVADAEINKVMKPMDLVEANLNGGILATDEEYEVAYAQFQVLANKIMNGGTNG